MYAIKCFVHIYLVNEGEDSQGPEPGGKPRKARGRPHTAMLTVWLTVWLTVMFFFASVCFIALSLSWLPDWGFISRGWRSNAECELSAAHPAAGSALHLQRPRKGWGGGAGDCPLPSMWLI